MNTKVKVIKASNTGARNRNALDLELKRVAAYCRVSTDSKDQLESYKSQVDYYTNLIKNNKNWTLAGIYVFGKCKMYETAALFVNHLPTSNFSSS